MRGPFARRGRGGAGGGCDAGMPTWDLHLGGALLAMAPATAYWKWYHVARALGLELFANQWVQGSTIQLGSFHWTRPPARCPSLPFLFWLGGQPCVSLGPKNCVTFLFCVGLGCSDFHCLPTNSFSMKPLSLNFQQKATESVHLCP